MKDTLLLAMLIASTSGCATSQVVPVPATEFTLETRDQPESRTFRATLVSHSSRDICFAESRWPGERGRFVDGDNFASIEVADGVLPSSSGELDRYCIGGCNSEIRLRPGEVLQGTISYAVFGDADQIAASPVRRLSFSVDAHYCRR